MVLESSTTVWFIRMLLEKNLERPLLLSSALMPVGCMTTTALYLLQCLLMVNPRSFLLHSVSFQLRIKKTGRRFFLLFLHAGYDNDVEHPGEPFLEGGPWPLSIISDRQKGLLPAIEELSIVDWTIKHYYCTQHLATAVHLDHRAKTPTQLCKTTTELAPPTYSTITTPRKVLCTIYVLVCNPDRYIIIL